MAILEQRGSGIQPHEALQLYLAVRASGKKKLKANWRRRECLAMTPPQRSRHGLATISSPIASLRAELPERFFDGFIFGVALVEFLQ